MFPSRARTVMSLVEQVCPNTNIEYYPWGVTVVVNL